MRQETVAPPKEKTVEPSTVETSTQESGDASDEDAPSSESAAADEPKEKEQPEKDSSDASQKQPDDKTSETADKGAEEDSGDAAALPESATDGEFVVQLGSFSDERNARALAESVKSSGFDVFVTPLFSEQGTVWRVRVGPYATREQASEATERLRQRIGRDGLVMTK
nr:SPOR domain-containing protein [Guyparkeria hydrothermalis]